MKCHGLYEERRVSINPGLGDAHTMVLLVVRITKALGTVRVGARLCSDVVGDEAHAKESVALDDSWAQGYGWSRIEVRSRSRNLVNEAASPPGLNIEGRDMGKQHDLPICQN